MEETHYLASPLVVSWSDQGSNALQSERHAVLRTLYSRAHRVGLNGDSCLLRSLRKGVSLDLLLALVVRVLA